MAGNKPKPNKRNPVAKYAAHVQRACVFRDRTKYRRRAKHKGHEPFPLIVVGSYQWKGFISSQRA